MLYLILLHFSVHLMIRKSSRPARLLHPHLLHQSQLDGGWVVAQTGGGYCFAPRAHRRVSWCVIPLPFQCACFLCRRFPYPSVSEIVGLSSQTKFSEEQIKVWFSAQRLKHGVSWTPEEVGASADAHTQTDRLQLNFPSRLMLFQLPRESLI